MSFSFYREPGGPFPDTVTNFLRFRRLCGNVERHHTFLLCSQSNDENAIQLYNEIEETMSDIKSSLEVKKAAAESAAVPFDLENKDWEEYWAVLEDLDDRAQRQRSGYLVEGESYRSGEDSENVSVQGSANESAVYTEEWFVLRFKYTSDFLKQLSDVMNDFIKTLSGIGSVTPAGIRQIDTGPQSEDFNRAMSDLNKQINKFEEARQLIEGLEIDADDQIMQVIRESLALKKKECVTQLNQMKQKLMQFQRTCQRTGPGNGTSSQQDQHNTEEPNEIDLPDDVISAKRFKVETGPVVENASSCFANFYLSYALNENNFIYILFEEREGQKPNRKQVICEFEICDGNLVMLRNRKVWSEARTLSKIAISGGKLFGATKEAGQNGSVEQLDVVTLRSRDRNPISPAVQYDKVEHFLLVGTPDKLITMECQENHKNLFSIFANKQQIGQQSADIPPKMHAFRSFYHGDYLFHAGEQSNDLVAVKILEQGELLEQFEVYNLKLEYMNSVHGIVGIDKGSQIYIVAIQGDKLCRLMIYEFTLRPSSNKSIPSIQLVQVEDLKHEVMALIRTANRDKIVFLTVEEKIGILDLNLINDEIN